MITKREKEILNLVAGGMTNAEIGAHLNIAEETVKTHVKRILSKLSAKSRANAVAIAFRQKLIH